MDNFWIYMTFTLDALKCFWMHFTVAIFILFQRLGRI
jgi:hypothetical protein